ncbi:MAG: hypothetical protein IJN63_03265, partial [Clostridia bacterium]|nr:hypothetical protein [Clostridia bacterium]
LASDVSLTGSATVHYEEPTHKGKIVITAMDGDKALGTKLKLKGGMVYALSGPTEFADLTIDTGAGNTIIAARFNPIVMGEGLTMSSTNLNIVGGFEAPKKNSDTKSSSSITIKSGRYANVVGFSRTKGDATLTYTGTSRITVYDGTINNIYGASLFNHYSGSTEIKVYGGMVTAVHTGGDVTRRLDGTSLIELHDGTINRISIVNAIGDTKVVLNGGTVRVMEEVFRSTTIETLASNAVRSLYYNSAAFTADQIQKLAGKIMDGIYGHGTLYVQSGATGSGKSEDDPIGSIEAAISTISSGGDIRIIGSYPAGAITEPAHEGLINIVPNKEGDCIVASNGVYTQNGPTAFAIPVKGAFTVNANGNELRLDNGFDSDGNTVIYGTENADNNAHILLNSGKVKAVYASKNGQNAGKTAVIEVSGAVIDTLKASESGSTSGALSLSLSAGEINTADLCGVNADLTVSAQGGKLGSITAGVGGKRPDGVSYSLKYDTSLFNETVFAGILPLFGDVSNTKIVYVADNGNGNGLTVGGATNLTNAFKQLEKTGGVIVIVGETSITSALNSTANASHVTITSLWEGKDYRKDGAYILLGNNWQFNGEVTLENLNITLDKTAPLLRFNNHNATIGDNIVITKPEKFANFPTIMAGKSGNWNSAEYTLTINSGTFNRVYLTNDNAGATHKDTNATLVINGGEFQDPIYASYAEDFSGSATVIVNGGILRAGIFGSGKSGTSFNGTLTYEINGGTIIGKIAAAYTKTTTLSGDMYLKLNGGTFNGVTDIIGPDEFSGRMEPHVSVGAGVDIFAKETGTHSYTNPIVSAADPWVIYKDGFYYFTKTAGSSIGVAKATNLGDLAHAEMITVFDPPDGREYSKNLWSPELHYYYQEDFPDDPDFTEGWYILLACDNGDNYYHRMFCIKALTDDPQGPYGHPLTREQNIPIKILSDTDPNVGEIWAAGQTDARINGQLYCLWVSEVTEPNHRYQTLNISKMKNPWSLTGPTAIVCKPTESWEKGGATYAPNNEGKIWPEVVEGIAVATAPDGNTYMLYAGSGYWTPYYCIAQQKLVGDDPAVYENWYKYPQPLVTKSDELNGTGHNCFTISPDGKTNFIVYHAYVGTDTNSGRYMIAETYTFTEDGIKIGDGDGHPAELEKVFSVPVNTMPLIKKFKGWKNEIADYLTVDDVTVGVGAQLNIIPTLADGAKYAADTHGDLVYSYKEKGSFDKFGNGLPPTDKATTYIVNVSLAGINDYSGISTEFEITIDPTIEVVTDPVTTEPATSEPPAEPSNGFPMGALIPIGAAVVIAVIAVILAAKKKKK